MVVCEVSVVGSNPVAVTWYDWSINYILELIRKIVAGFKDKVISLFKTNTPKQTVHERGKKLNKSKTQKQSEGEEDHHKSKRVGNSWNNNYIEHESNGDRNKNISLKKCLKKLNLNWGI